MRSRLTSSFFIVVIGVLAAVIGGPVYSVLLIFLGISGIREYFGLAARVSAYPLDALAPIGYGVVAAMGLTALVAPRTTALIAVVSLAIALPLVVLCVAVPGEGAFVAWTLTSAGALYLGIPIFAAVALRELPGETGSRWVTDLASALRLGWDATPRGLAWTLTVVFATWLGDSAAYLAGRSFGRHRLAPNVSPNKTIEGAAAGLASAAAVGGIAFFAFGLDPAWFGIAVGAVISVSGQIGDLAESMLKRQAGAKDSGSFIPGHGGILDRIDALLFAFPAGLLLASGHQWFRP